jgi:ergothioneine biosynthesis protein EgtB
MALAVTDHSSLSRPSVRDQRAGLGTPRARDYAFIRRRTEELCEPLERDDFLLQSMPEASPAKWHLAHTTWFFETFVLAPFVGSYRLFDPQFGFLFNSYYEAIGDRWPRSKRALLSRPTVDEVFRYRQYVDEQIGKLLEGFSTDDLEEVVPLLELGLHHEQQHQELIVTDLKHAWSTNPLHPVYREAIAPDSTRVPNRAWVNIAGGLVEIGHGGSGFSFDNESPRHTTFLRPFLLANRLTTNEEYLAFIADGGYDRPVHWLSDGWSARQAEGWTAPLYWQKHEGRWCAATLAGLRPIDPGEPVCHLSFYEADAFARWAGCRLPTEAEWETAAAQHPVAGHFQESGRFHPSAAPAADDRGPAFQLFGDLWQWTSSPYLGYPGYRPEAGAVGEYNGKFMCNQFVLRGASCATPRSHARRTYRNFFPPNARWQFTGIRLAKDVP